MSTLAQRKRRQRSPLHFGGSLIAPPPEDYLSQFYDTRRGFGAGVDAGYGPAYEVLTVTTTADSGTGSLRAALATTGPTIVRFAPGLGDIVDPNRAGYPCTDDTLLDGHGYTGTIYGFVKSVNCDNFVAMFVSVTQPFAYGADPSGGVLMASNCPRAYFYKCTGWDTGDVIFASGAYELTSGGSGDKTQPYFFTVDQCRFGPNPGAYAIMSPIRGDHPGVFPGSLNGIDNDARNGKCMNCAYDHQAVADGRPLSDFDHVAYGTMVNNVMQGCQIRNGKGRSETVDVISNLVAKYGTPFDLGGPSISHGAGSACDDNGTVNIEGNVYIPYNDGEQIVGFQDAVADPLIAANPSYGMARIRVTDAVDNNAIKAEGTAATKGNARIGLNYVDGQSVQPAKFATGFDRSVYYDLSVPDVSTYAAAQALVAQLEDDPDTRAGNPFSTTQPPGWRDVHTGPLFPVGG